MNTPQLKIRTTLEEFRKVLHTADRKSWFDLGVFLFNRGDARPEMPPYQRRLRVRDEILAYGWDSARLCKQP